MNCCHTFIWTLCVFYWLAQCQGQDLDVCTPSTGVNKEKPPPKLPEKYHVAVSVIIANKNKSIDMEEYYDGPGNRGSLIFHGTVNKQFIYSYDTEEIIEIDRSPSLFGQNCMVEKMSADKENELIFGYQKTNGSHAHIYTAAGALRIGGNLTEEYMGKANHAGINCDRWYSCVYWPHQNTTMNVTWYFSDPDSWRVSESSSSIPIRADVQGSVISPDGTKRNFSHKYYFQQFEDATQYPFDDSVFQIPRGVYCPKQNQKALPTLPPYFQVTAEIIYPDFQGVSYISEFYDKTSKLISITYKPLLDEGYGLNPLRETHDFNTGVSYVTDLVTRNCSVKPLNVGAFTDEIYDARKVDNLHIRMSTVAEFLGFGGNVSQNWTYSGVRKVRDIDCDVWTAVKMDWPPSPEGRGKYSVWEIYFSTVEWGFVTGEGTPPEFQIPIKVEIHQHKLGLHSITNLINYDYTRPRFTQYSLESCNVVDRRRFQLTFPGPFISKIQDRKDFITSFTIALVLNIGIKTPLRVAAVKLKSVSDKIQVLFSLMDRVNLRNTKVVNPLQEISLAEASKNLLQAVLSGHINLTLSNDVSPTAQTVAADPGSLIETTSSTDLFGGTRCPVSGVSNQKPLPSMSPYFSVTREIIDPTFKSIQYVKEYYDSLYKYIWLLYRPEFDMGYGTNPLMEIHDFNTGVSYITDKYLGNCSYRALDSHPHESVVDAKKVDSTHLRMATSAEILGLGDLGNKLVTNWTYIGKRNVKKIDCNVWTACKTDWPPVPEAKGKVSVWNWFFTQKSWGVVSGGGDDPEFQVPVRLVIRQPELGIRVIYNFINYDDTWPAANKYDISSCYEFKKRRNFQIAFNGDYKTLVANKRKFLWTFRFYLYLLTDLSPIRVTNVKVDQSDGKVLVRFTMLDKAPAVQTTFNIPNKKQEVLLDDAADRFTDSVKTGNFTMEVDLENSKITIVAKPQSLKEIIHEVDTVYQKQIQMQHDGSLSNGAVAGIAVAMVVVGLLIGVAIMFTINRFRGNSPFQPKKFDNEVQMDN